MRTINSIRNTATALTGQVISMVIGFVTRTIFIYMLGDEYLGVNGVFASVLTLLSLTELGFGSAITYALYKPISDKNEKATAALMNLYANVYKVVGVVVTVIGVALIPFLGYIIKNVPNVSNINVIYILFLSNTVISYFFSYKRSIITAHQLEYVNTINQNLFLIIQNILQITVLLIFKEYLFYLSIQIICTLFSNIAISHKANKMYPYLRENKKNYPDKDTMSVVKKNVVAVFFHQFGGVVVTGTDNLMIAWVDVVLVGLYSNYLLIVQTVTIVLKQMFNSLTASVGNLVVSEDVDKQKFVYDDIFFVNAWLYGFCAIAIDILSTPFLRLLYGSNYILSDMASHIIALNFYFMGMRQTNIIFINAAGLFYPIRYKSLIEAAINVVASALFLVGFKIGLFGVLLGTLVSTLSTNFWWEPYTVYKNCFKEPLHKYFLKFGLYFGVTGISYIFSYVICKIIPSNNWLWFAVAVFICTLTPNLIFLLIYHRTAQFIYFKTLITKIIRRIKI